ncbi:hypothetical protein [Maribacter sp. ACAM166]|uniref:hypothetical protein n=1 Tax=Maribacter sp. ACAM166 TaxID=2508996 RepID=UPI0010FD02C4|nr:hypothetical protein [Maribacter sp. ACAM166]TLP82304.1 hypothetical protein ES765_02400 [Maribacter sp. ACAM166]
MKQNIHNVAIKCVDSDPFKIEKHLARSDNFSGDGLEVNIDSYNNKQTGFSYHDFAGGVKGISLFLKTEIIFIQVGILSGTRLPI